MMLKTFSTTSLTAVRDVKMLITSSWNCHFRGHLIITLVGTIQRLDILDHKDSRIQLCFFAENCLATMHWHDVILYAVWKERTWVTAGSFPKWGRVSCWLKGRETNKVLVQKTEVNIGVLPVNKNNQKLDHSTTGHVWTIWIPNLSIF